MYGFRHIGYFFKDNVQDSNLSKTRVLTSMRYVCTFCRFLTTVSISQIVYWLRFAFDNADRTIWCVKNWISIEMNVSFQLRTSIHCKAAKDTSMSKCCSHRPTMHSHLFVNRFCCL